MKVYLRSVLLALSFATLMACNGIVRESKSGRLTDGNADAQPVPMLTLERFGKVKMGMSYSEVEGILGKGAQVAYSEISGLVTESYQWRDEVRNTSMTVMFQNNKAVSKAQAGLR